MTIDIPAENCACATALAAAWGLDMTGVLTRMGRGPRVIEDFDRLWATRGRRRDDPPNPRRIITASNVRLRTSFCWAQQDLIRSIDR